MTKPYLVWGWQCCAENPRSSFRILNKCLQAKMWAMPTIKDPWEEILLKGHHPFDKCLK